MSFKTLRATIDSISEHQTVLLIENQGLPEKMKNQKLILPKKMLPDIIKEGDVLVFEISVDAEYRETREQTARKLLEDILNNK